MGYDSAMKIKTTETVNIGLRMPVDLREKIEEIAKSEDRSLSSQIIRLLREALASRAVQGQPLKD